MKAWKRLASADRVRLRDAIDRLMDGDLKKLRGQEDRFRLRVGAFRVIFMPDFQGRVIVVLDIFPRGRGYR